MRTSEEIGEHTLQEIRQRLSTRLRSRLPIIEDAIFQKVRTISTPTDSPEYLHGIRSALTEAIEYVLVGIEAGETAPPSIPPAARTQARRAARSGITLDTVLRRYHAGDRLMAQFIVEEARDLPSDAVQTILSTQGPQIDHLTAGVANEYMHEIGRLRTSPAQRLRERILRMVEGDSDLDAEIRYEFNVCHVGMIGAGAGVEQGMRNVASRLDCQLLLVPADDHDVFWVWLGRRRDLSIGEIEEVGRDENWRFLLAIGEPRRQIDGWRLTHREAQIAQAGMLQRQQQITRARDVILISAVLRDPFIARSLSETYLSPLDGRGDFKETLRAYFKADRNAATAAAAMGVARHTVERRVRRVEEILGQSLASCDAQLQVALGAEDLLRNEVAVKSSRLHGGR